MVGFYESMTGFPEPFWITCECPQCSGGLDQSLICEHGFLFRAWKMNAPPVLLSSSKMNQIFSRKRLHESKTMVYPEQWRLLYL